MPVWLPEVPLVPLVELPVWFAGLVLLVVELEELEDPWLEFE